jgi:hypothetical protein
VSTKKIKEGRNEEKDGSDNERANDIKSEKHKERSN